MSIFSELKPPEVIYQGSSKYNPDIKVVKVGRTLKITVDGCKKMADDAFNGTGNLPDYLYTKLDDSGDFLIYNIFEKVAVAPDDTWERNSWLIAMYDETRPDGYSEWITRDWDNYVNGSNIGAPDGIVRYVFPIPTIGIDNSKGLLKNDGYGFGF